MRTLCILVVMICIPTTCRQLRAQETELRYAWKLYEDKEYLKAASILERICKQHPDLADAHRLSGHVYYQLGRYEDARNSMVQAIAHGCLASDVLSRLAQIDQQRKRTVQILTGLEIRTLIDPTNTEWNLLYADFLVSVGENKRAEEIYKAVIKTDPSSPEVFVRIGNLYLGQGKHKEAVCALESAYYLGYSNPALSRNIAEIWFTLGDLTQSLVWYDRALSIKPEPSSTLRYAELLISSGELEHSERILQPLINSKDKYIETKAVLLLGQIFIQRKQIDKAIKHLEQAIHAGLNAPEILAFLGSHYFNSGQYKKASAYLSKRLESGDDDKDLLRYLILSLIRSGEQEQAKSEIQRYMEHYGLDENAEKIFSFFVQNIRPDKK